MIQQAIVKLLDRQDLSADEARAAVEAIMEGEAGDVRIAAFLVALRMKGETADEIAGAAAAMRGKVTPVHVERRPLLDVVGTGGDELGTFNISTATALVAAAAGAVVAKHGNRSVSSTSGSADVLAELGVNIEADVPTVEACIRRTGVGFCFAPLLHKAMKYAMPVRKALGVPTVFNVLGPLTNPAGADRQLLGVGRADQAECIARALLQLGVEHAFVVHSDDGQDEVALTSPTGVWEVGAGRVEPRRWTPDDFGLPGCRLDDLTVGSPAESAALVTGVLEGRPGPARDTVLANAAAALVAAGLADDLRGGVTRAAEALDSGKARATLRELVEVSHGRA